MAENPVTELDEDDLEVIPETLDDDEAATQVGGKSVIELPLGSDLSAENLAAFRLSRPVRSIALVGAHRSGKTTLVSELYNAFCKGPFQGFKFAGSRTLEGFERRLWEARLQSRRTAADTPRTSINAGLVYLHLSLLRPDRTQIDLAWGDRAGEAFKAIQSAQTIDDIPSEIASSSHITLLLDGARLADIGERQNAIQETYQTLWKLTALGAVDHSQRIGIVTTKVDLLHDPAVRQQADDLHARLRRQCSQLHGSIGELTFYETSVRTKTPRADDEEPRLGLAKLLHHWSETFSRTPERLVQPPLDRPYDRYLLMGESHD